MVLPVFLLFHGRNTNGQIRFLELDAAYGQHHYFQHSLGLGLSRVERRRHKGHEVPRIVALLVDWLDRDCRLRKSTGGFKFALNACRPNLPQNGIPSIFTPLLFMNMREEFLASSLKLGSLVAI